MEIEQNVIKKKRGRKPKNSSIEENIEIIEKKKRGRKKKYEIENFDKIVNRNELNNFNHEIVYSDNEQEEITENSTKQISFGNLNITISKKDAPLANENCYRGLLQETPRSSIINEFESDEETFVPIESIINENEEEQQFEKVYKENKKYVTDFTENIKEHSVKRIRVVTCLKNVVTNDQWPDKCDICCWWCCHTFNGVPSTLPTRYDPLRKRFTFTGIFCSWNCSKSYNNNMGDHKRFERNTYLTLLMQQLYGVETSLRIKPAPPRECLKMFGGYLDINEFRNKYHVVDCYHINLIKHNFVFPDVSEVTNIKVNSRNSLNNDKKNLRLQRT
jgi:hypothetical protein